MRKIEIIIYLLLCLSCLLLFSSVITGEQTPEKDNKYHNIFNISNGNSLIKVSIRNKHRIEPLSHRRIIKITIKNGEPDNDPIKGWAKVFGDEDNFISRQHAITSSIKNNDFPNIYSPQLQSSKKQYSSRPLGFITTKKESPDIIYFYLELRERHRFNISIAINSNIGKKCETYTINTYEGYYNVSNQQKAVENSLACEDIYVSDPEGNKENNTSANNPKSENENQNFWERPLGRVTISTIGILIAGFITWLQLYVLYRLRIINSDVIDPDWEEAKSKVMYALYTILNHLTT